ncbi:type II secretion system protein [Vibrio europaeus]|uniref:type II secretion system protein n=1 Tax=Vibrio europaeus TaxID=300876 RepID=UPI00233E81BA|nr:type II secretion system protein [Vibrio europaeus]MDC5870270.1 type II secretion system protein [Vibrio europaeus]
MQNTNVTELKQKKSKKQGGWLSFEFTLIIGAVAAILLGVLALLPWITYKWNLNTLTTDVTIIGDAAVSTQKRSGNFSNVTYAKMCTKKHLDTTYCGSNPGRAVNPFGGNYDFRPNAANPGLREILITIPNDPDRIPDIADTLANISRNNCEEASGCTTLQVSGNQIIVTL